MKRWGGLSAFTETGNEKYSWVKKPFLLLCLSYAFALLAILRANYYYIDDQGRALIGYRGWLDWSRYVSEGISYLVQPTPGLTDASPLPQLLAVAIMAIVGVLVIYTLTGKKEIGWSLWIGALPMGLSPWFLECFSYKFDAPYMAISVLTSVLPFLWWEKDRKKFYVISFFSLLVMTMTYQASAGIFVIETLFLSFFSWMRGRDRKNIFLWMLRAALIYLVALLIFKAFFAGPPVEGYVSTKIAPLAQIPVTFLRNAASYVEMAWQDLNMVARIFVAATFLFWLLHVRSFTQRNRLLTLLLAVLFLVVTMILSYGPFLVLEKPLLLPRGLLAMGVWFSFLLISLLFMTEKKGLAKWLVLLIIWQLATGAAAYGNALADQKRYTDFRVRLVVQDLDELHLTENNDIKYHILGDIGKSPLVRNVEQEYPAVKRLVAPTFCGGDTWTTAYFFLYHDLALHGESELEVERKENPKDYIHLPVALENRYHKIQTDGRDVLIYLKESHYE